MAKTDRGDVWIIDLGYAAKTRPCLILSIPTLVSDRALITIIPYTSQARGTRFEVAISTAFLSGGVFDAQNPITTLHAKLLRKMGELTPDQIEHVETAVRHWLGL